MPTSKFSLSVTCCLFLIPAMAPSQQMNNLDRDRAQVMLSQVMGEVRKHYYDPAFHGLNWEQTTEEARKKIDVAPSNNMALANIAATLDKLNDSHTFFLPPMRPYHHDYGFNYLMVGDRCFVGQVRPKSDAETKGLKPGDEILSINDFTPTRDTLWKLEYVFGVLRPQPSLQLELQSPTGEQRKIEVAAKIVQGKLTRDLTKPSGDFWDLVRQDESFMHLMRARWAEFGDQLAILKFGEFIFSPVEVRSMTGKARKYKALIIDLRGNPGGAVETLKRLTGDMFEKNVKIADLVERKDKKVEMADGAGGAAFTGKLIVLVDSRSASSSEMFARVMQLEKRGIVLGDQTSGSVMESRHYLERAGADTVVFYGVSVTIADVIMSDGKSLEHVGITPDQLMLPSAAAIAAGKDPVLAYAAELAGVKLTPEEAGKLFPYEWMPQ